MRISYFQVLSLSLSLPSGASSSTYFIYAVCKASGNLPGIFRLHPLLHTLQLACMRTTTLKVLSALTFAFIPKSNAFSQVGLGTAVPFKLSRNSILKRSMASFKDTSIKAPNPHNFSWQQTMLRIKDPARTLPFYRDNFGFTLIHQFNFPQW